MFWGCLCWLVCLATTALMQGDSYCARCPAPTPAREACAQVLKVRDDPAVQRMVFTGHSLGGAIALLAYLWARANPAQLHQQEVKFAHCSLTTFCQLHTILDRPRP